MPFHPIFHERHSASLARVRNDHVGAHVARLEGAANRKGIMTVDLLGRQAEGTELLGQRLETRDLARRPKALEPVQVNQYRQVVELVVPAKISASQQEPSFHSPSDVRQKTRPGSDFSSLPLASPAASDRP